MKNALEYCRIIEEKDIFHKKLEPTLKIIDSGAPLVSLLHVNFRLIYEQSIMPNYQYLIRAELVEKLGRIANELVKQDKTLVIRSAWRSFEHQRILWERNLGYMKEKFPDKTDQEIHETTSYFIAPPNKSTHSTGGAIDALIFDEKTKQILDFGSNEGHRITLDKKCYPHHPDISNLAKQNRKLMLDLFNSEDFVCDLKEFWHFDYGNIGWAIEKGKDFAFYGIIEKVTD